MRISILSVAINLALYYPLIQILDFAGLAAATSISGLVNFIVLAAYLPSKGVTIPWGKLTLNLMRITLAALLAFYIALLLPYNFTSSASPVVDRLQRLLVPTGVALLLYLLFCFLLRVQEIHRLTRLIQGKRQPEG